MLLVFAVFTPATQTHSYTEMVVDRFQSSKCTTKTTGIKYARLGEDNVKEVTQCVFRDHITTVAVTVLNTDSICLYIFLHQVIFSKTRFVFSKNEFKVFQSD